MLIIHNYELERNSLNDGYGYGRVILSYEENDYVS